jgi:hypothetical protein
MIRAEHRAGAALLTILFAVPFALGWIAGATVYASTWLYAALLAGYRTAAEGWGADAFHH